MTKSRLFVLGASAALSFSIAAVSAAEVPVIDASNNYSTAQSQMQQQPMQLADASSVRANNATANPNAQGIMDAPPVGGDNASDANATAPAPAPSNVQANQQPARQVEVSEAHPSHLADQAAAAQAQANNYPQARSGSNSNANAILLARLQQLQEQMQQLRGNLEVQSHDLKLLQQQQQAYYSDLDQRVSRLSGNKATNKSNPQLAQNNDKPMSLDLNNSAATATNASAHTDYETAFSFIKAKQFDKATAAMQQFLRQHAGSKYAANAHYWLGELSLAQGQFDAAINEFNSVLKQYPGSNKVAASMLKLGFAYSEKGNVAKAKQLLQKVQQSFPDSTSAQLAKVRLQRLSSQ